MNLIQYIFVNKGYFLLTLEGKHFFVGLISVCGIMDVGGVGGFWS